MRIFCGAIAGFEETKELESEKETTTELKFQKYRINQEQHCVASFLFLCHRNHQNRFGIPFLPFHEKSKSVFLKTKKKCVDV